jgi:hypothetical protein
VAGSEGGELDWRRVGGADHSCSDRQLLRAASITSGSCARWSASAVPAVNSRLCCLPERGPPDSHRGPPSSGTDVTPATRPGWPNEDAPGARRPGLDGWVPWASGSLHRLRRQGEDRRWTGCLEPVGARQARRPHAIGLRHDQASGMDVAEASAGGSVLAPLALVKNSRPNWALAGKGTVGQTVRWCCCLRESLDRTASDSDDGRLGPGWVCLRLCFT